MRWLREIRKPEGLNDETKFPKEQAIPEIPGELRVRFILTAKP